MARGTITESLKITFQNILFHGRMLVNDLPTLIRNAESLSAFKIQLKTLFFCEHLT